MMESECMQGFTPAQRASNDNERAQRSFAVRAGEEQNAPAKRRTVGRNAKDWLFVSAPANVETVVHVFPPLPGLLAVSVDLEHSGVVSSENPRDGGRRFGIIRASYRWGRRTESRYGLGGDFE